MFQHAEPRSQQNDNNDVVESNCTISETAHKMPWTAAESECQASDCHLNINHEQDIPQLRSRRRLDFRLLLPLCWLAIITTVDVTAIGSAFITGLSHDLHFDPHDFNVAVAVFFIPVVLLDVPANILIYATRPSIFLGTVVFLFGIVTICEGVVHNIAGLIACRVLLGICEVGFQAGGLYLIVSYYPRHIVHFRVNLFLSCRLFSNAFGGLLAFGLAHLNGLAGYSGWRWIFIIEGIITVTSAVVLCPFIPGWPETSTLVLDQETRVCSYTSKQDSAAVESWRHACIAILCDPKVYLGASIHFCCRIATASQSAWLPTILHDLGWTSDKALYMGIPVFLTAVIITILNSIISDKLRHRFAFCAGPLCIAVVGYSLLLAGPQVSPRGRYAACYLVTAGAFSGVSTSVAWLSNNITDRKRRGVALGLAAGIANLGSIVGSNVFLRSQMPSYVAGYAISLAAICLAIVLAAVQLAYLHWANGRNRSCVRGEGLLPNML